MAGRLSLFLLLSIPSLGNSQEPTTLIRNAFVVDGTGAAGQVADVRIAGTVILQIGKLRRQDTDTVIDATGLVLAPGFVDSHSHHDRGLAENRDALGAVSQGITTIVVGQDGDSDFPLADFFAGLEQRPPAVNVASYAGHGTLRSLAMGDDFRRPATEAEVRRMAELLEQELKAGALGLGSGLEYDPGIYSTRDEMMALARVAAAAGGRYISHIRSEDFAFWAAIDEIIAIGREARLPVQISHAKLAMRNLWGRSDSLLGLLDQARRNGVDITMDIYPYTYWLSTLTVLFPHRDFQNRASAEFALQEVAPAESAFVIAYEPDPTIVGKSIETIAAERGMDPPATLIALIGGILEPKPDGGGYEEGVMATSMRAEDIEELIKWPYANVSSDGVLNGAHPRGFGAFTRFYRLFVRERKVLSIEGAVRRMTSLSAHNVGLTDRGRIAKGLPADLVLFDPIMLADNATPAEPHLLSTGIEAVWVNGTLVFHGLPTGARPGKVLRRPSTPARQN